MFFMFFTYLEKGNAHQLLRELMALPFLPHESNPDMFNKLKQRAQTGMLKQRVWIDGEWKPEAWTTFMQSMRTNNDVEGWHNRINRSVDNIYAEHEDK
ncbi:uncharacterized protein [Amphiura filiformis]|uniref:uncharacterized protein n=1 Tax=Amphiura filiformis TaxID=82378 RepID=UPI003B226F6A